MKQTIEIKIPDGKKVVWKDNNIIFEDIKPQLPKTWKEFCEQNSVKSGECYIDAQGDIFKSGCKNRDIYEDINMLPSQKAAEQHLAFIQLHQLRDCYRQGWIPSEYKVLFGIIRRIDGSLNVDRFMYSSRFLSFPNKEIAEEFLTNFHDLIEQVGDLI